VVLYILCILIYLDSNSKTRSCTDW
jgi:hypothetical protein